MTLGYLNHVRLKIFLLLYNNVKQISCADRWTQILIKANSESIRVNPRSPTYILKSNRIECCNKTVIKFVHIYSYRSWLMGLFEHAEKGVHGIYLLYKWVPSLQRLIRSFVRLVASVCVFQRKISLLDINKRSRHFPVMVCRYLWGYWGSKIKNEWAVGSINFSSSRTTQTMSLYICFD